MQRLRFLPAILMFVVSPMILSAADPVMYCDDSAPPGGVLQVTVTGGSLENLSISLVDSRDRAVSRAEGFSWRGPGGRRVSVALIGIPSTVDPGNYTLVLHADQGRARWRQEKTVRVTDVDFPERVISMNGKMGTLYSDESERKKSESRILWTALTSFDPAAQYHVDSFVMPLEGGVPTAGFGDRRRYRLPDGSESSSVHYGRDLWAEKGTPVVAAARGRVVLAAERYLTGNTVVIEHLPGVFTLYYHMDSIEVFEGEIVSAGDQVGTVGETGFATGEHLHWEMRVGGTPVDPSTFLERPLLDTNGLISNM